MQAMERRRQVQSQSRHLEDRSFVRICTPRPSFLSLARANRRLGYGVDVDEGERGAADSENGVKFNDAARCSSAR